MKTVIVSWTTENRPFPPTTPAPHHFRVGLALQEADVPLDTLEHTFDNVEIGSMAGFVAVCSEDGTELAPPITFSVEVPEDVMVPVPVSAGGVVQ